MKHQKQLHPIQAWDAMVKNLTDCAIEKAARDPAISAMRRDLSDAGRPGSRVRLTQKGLRGAMTRVLPAGTVRGAHALVHSWRLSAGRRGVGVSAAREAARELHLSRRMSARQSWYSVAMKRLRSEAAETWRADSR